MGQTVMTDADMIIIIVIVKSGKAGFHSNLSKMSLFIHQIQQQSIEPLF